MTSETYTNKEKFTIRLSEGWWDYAEELGAEQSGFIDNKCRYTLKGLYYWNVSGMTKKLFWEKMKELRDMYINERLSNFKKEIDQYEEKQKIDNEQEELSKLDYKNFLM